MLKSTGFLFLWLLLATEGSLDEKNCSSEWSAYGLRRFKFFKNHKGWIDAETECLKHGGNLASIHGTEEHAFIQNLIKEGAGFLKKTWIGGHDTVKEGTWLWSDGSKMNFKAWKENQPDNFKEKEHCLEVNYGADHIWNDNPCGERKPFVCAKN